ncbi:MAG: HEAT repeat domain-containing protein [Planctomycetota bacterium]
MQSYYCFRCSNPIPENELELGQIVLTKQGKAFCLRCVTRIQTQYPKLLILSFFLSVFLVILELFRFLVLGSDLSPSRQKYLETKLEQYVEKESFENSLNRYKISIREYLNSLSKDFQDLSLQTQKEISKIQNQLQTALEKNPQNNESTIDWTPIQQRLDQQAKDLSRFTTDIESLQKQMQETQTQITQVRERISRLKTELSLTADPKNVAVLDLEDVQILKKTDPIATKSLLIQTSSIDFSKESWQARLKDRNPNIRMAAILELSKLSESEVIPLLLEATKDDYNFARQAAIKALGDKKVESSVSLLIKSLDDPHKGVQDAALKALYQILQKEWGQEYERLDLKKQMIQSYQKWWESAGQK